MSHNRDKAFDRVRTREVVAGTRQIVDSQDPRKNWLDHFLDRATSRLNELLLKGATEEELREVRGDSALDHIKHLRRDHGVPVTKGPDGKWRFDEQQLDLPQ